jgi:hypothetical protein
VRWPCCCQFIIKCLFDFSFSNHAATLSTASDEDPDTEKNTNNEDTNNADDDQRRSKNEDESNFDRHTFPRDSGCFASSSPASDRSSQQSQSESGIHLPHDDEEDYSDEATPKQPQKRPAEKSAHTRSLRDRHTITPQVFEKLSLRSSPIKAKKDATFDALVDKYVTSDKIITEGKVSSARSVFEAQQK